MTLRLSTKDKNRQFASISEASACFSYFNKAVNALGLYFHKINTKQLPIFLQKSKYVAEEKNLVETGIYIPEYTAELDVELISRIINDERVELVLEETDDVGLDQVK